MQFRVITTGFPEDDAERKASGGYIFIHRLLQDYFAELWEKEYAEKPNDA